ncbi:MAG TPA: hypothetical protein VM536_05395 [Chloroflexia bacterium]|nr:hypothetical protein [Chloroflexia bacterium]
MKRSFLLLLVTALACALAACDTSSATNTPVRPAPATFAPGPTPLAADVQIGYDVSGGIAGIRNALMIEPDGTTIVVSRGKPDKTVQLSAAEMNSLRGLASAANFFTLEDRYGLGAVPDDIVRSVTLRQNGRAKTVKTSDSSEDLIPPPLAELIRALQTILDSQLASP